MKIRGISLDLGVLKISEKLQIQNVYNIFLGDSISQFSRLNNWRDVGEGDIKIFLAHLIAMGLVQKGAIERNWDHGETVKTPFFGTYMGCNTFQAILSNLQVSDSTADLPCNNPNPDKLFKVHPFVDMMDRIFLQIYKAGRDLSVDEGCCPYKGRIHFKCYNPSKPSKWHLKLFEVSDARTGYGVAFEIYSGKNSTRIIRDAEVLDPQCNTTTKTVIGLMQKGNLLRKGHHVYMDNYYSSPELFYDLHYKEMFACGTCRSKQKNMPKSVTKAKLKKRLMCIQKKWPIAVHKVERKKRCGNAVNSA